ncbi:MAG: hypothetical protein AAFN10_01980 [Bacteroidota bacterium]
MCCKSCLLSLCLFVAVLLSPALLLAQSATKTLAETTTSVKAEAVAHDQAFTEGVVQKTKATKCCKPATCPPNCPAVCPPNCPPAQCKPSACKTGVATKVEAKPNAVGTREL